MLRKLWPHSRTQQKEHKVSESSSIGVFKKEAREAEKYAS